MDICYTPYFVVLVNTRNSGAKLERALTSLTQQDFVDWIALVTDDSSQDATPLSLKKMASQDHRILPFYNQSRVGALENTIKRLENLPGDPIIVVLDGDDYFLDSCSLRTLYEMYIRYPNTQLSIGGVIRKDSQGSVRLPLPFNKNHPFKRKDGFEHESFFFSHCRTFRYSLYKRIPHKFFIRTDVKTSVDITLNSILLCLAEEITLLQKHIYVWDIGESTEHDFYYSNKGVVQDPLGIRYTRRARMLAYFMHKGIPWLKVNRALITQNLITKLDPPNIIISGNFLNCSCVVVVPVYNPGDKFLRCIQSIKSSLTKKGQLGILVYEDNSSKPNKREIKRVLEGKGLPFCLMSNKNNKFKSHNLLQISRRVPLKKDTLLLFLDGDDYLSNMDVPLYLTRVYKEYGLEASLGSLQLEKRTPQNQRIQRALNSFSNRIPHDFSFPWDMAKCWSWFHLKSCLFHILNKVEEEFFTEEDNLTFLKLGEDNFVFPRCLEKAQNKKFIKDILYIYDTDPSTEHEDTAANIKYVSRIRENKVYTFTRTGEEFISIPGEDLSLLNKKNILDKLRLRIKN